MEITLLKSEIKKAEKYRKGKVTGYYTDNKVDDAGFVTVQCEICTGYDSDSTRLDDVILNCCTWDRRRTFASNAF